MYVNYLSSLDAKYFTPKFFPITVNCPTSYKLIKLSTFLVKRYKLIIINQMVIKSSTNTLWKIKLCLRTMYSFSKYNFYFLPQQR